LSNEQKPQLANHLEAVAAGIRELNLTIERERAVSRQRLEYAQALEGRMKDFERAWNEALQRDQEARKMIAAQAQQLAEADKRYQELDQRARTEYAAIVKRAQDDREALELRCEEERVRAERNDTRAKESELRLAEARGLAQRKDHEIRSQASRIEALRAECEAMQGVLLNEKSDLKNIAARVTDELQKIDAYEDFDTSILEEMLRSSQVKTIPTSS
jgi:hypothetical protein